MSLVSIFVKFVTSPNRDKMNSIKDAFQDNNGSSALQIVAESRQRRNWAYPYSYKSR